MIYPTHSSCCSELYVDMVSIIVRSPYSNCLPWRVSDLIQLRESEIRKFGSQFPEEAQKMVLVQHPLHSWIVTLDFLWDVSGTFLAMMYSRILAATINYRHIIKSSGIESQIYNLGGILPRSHRTRNQSIILGNVFFTFDHSNLLFWV